MNENMQFWDFKVMLAPVGSSSALLCLYDKLSSLRLPAAIFMPEELIAVK